MLSPVLSTLKVSLFFSKLPNKTFLHSSSLWSGHIESKKSNSLPSFFLTFSVPFSSNRQYLCWYNPISILGFCWDVWLSSQVTLMTSLSNIYFSLQNMLSHFFAILIVQGFPKSSSSAFFLLNNSFFNYILPLKFYYKVMRQMQATSTIFCLEFSLAKYLISAFTSYTFRKTAKYNPVKFFAIL